MTAKTKVWLLATAVMALGIGVTWKSLHHRDLPSNGPAVVASAQQPQGAETNAESAPASAPAASADATTDTSSPPTQSAASAAPQVVRRDSGDMGAMVAAAPGAGLIRKARLNQARGIIVSHTANVLVLQSDDEVKLKFDVPDAPDAAMTRAGLGKGERVVVEYTEENGRKVANSITRMQTHADTAKTAKRRD